MNRIFSDPSVAPDALARSQEQLREDMVMLNNFKRQPAQFIFRRFGMTIVAIRAGHHRQAGLAGRDFKTC